MVACHPSLLGNCFACHPGLLARTDSNVIYLHRGAEFPAETYVSAVRYALPATLGVMGTLSKKKKKPGCTSGLPIL